MATRHEWPATWNANWIWSELPPRGLPALAPAATVPKELWNRFCYLRRSFDLDKVPASAPARVTADSRFILYVNGVEVARGPTRSIPERLAWSEVDLAPYLRREKNALAALVRFYGAPMPWWRPAPVSFQLGVGSFAFEAPALAISSDASWKSYRAPYLQNVPRVRMLPVPPIEIVDGRDDATGWTTAEFDDSSWQPAVILSAGTFASNRIRPPVEPYTAMEHDDIAPLTAIEVSFTEKSRRTIASTDLDPLAAYDALNDSASGDSAITYETSETLATPWVEASGSRGSIIDIYVGEDLRQDLGDDGAVEIRPRHYVTRYILRGDGIERVEGFEAVGFRYATIIVRGSARVHRAGAIERRYPRSGNASFSCDDDRLNQIWRVGARTLDLCSTDAFLDCPGREQRAWLGDSYVHALVTYVTNSDWRLVRRHLRICAHSRRGDGLLGMVAVGDFSTSSTTIPDYSLHWVRALARYFEYSGDTALIRELAPEAIGVLAVFERYRARDGLLRGMPGWIFIDWAMTEKSEVVGALDALYTATLDDFAMLCERALKDFHSAATYRSQAMRTREAFQLLWDDTAGAYVDAADAHRPLKRVSQQTNAIAIVSGCARRDHWDRILKNILDESRLAITPTISDDRTPYIMQRMNPADYMKFDAETDIVAAQPFFCAILHDAVVRAGRRDLIPDLCLKWWPQIERGNTTFEEYWSGPAGEASRCHAWSATPTYDLTTHVLGVRPMEPGYRKVAIHPHFGKLARLAGRIPTPHGMIEVSFERDQTGTITIPAGIEADVYFEDADLRGGAFTSGTHTIGRGRRLRPTPL
ncbi:MAG TPA: alpha-L-rhamnosidase C-terminal domain-containing protein [Candidatus Binataceae bacterium]|nr:alpha-L-rhamnosidase C-terminal domain-containing protein [Candidatus Binataceae bacterium]